MQIGDSPANARVNNTTKTFSLILRTETVQPALLRGTNQTFFVESSMHMIQQIFVIAISVSKLLKGDTWVYRVDTHVPVYSLYRLCGRPAEIQPRPDARIVSAVESS